jgi:flagellar hook-length control protein FliK
MAQSGSVSSAASPSSPALAGVMSQGKEEESALDSLFSDLLSETGALEDLAPRKIASADLPAFVASLRPNASEKPTKLGEALEAVADFTQTLNKIVALLHRKVAEGSQEETIETAPAQEAAVDLQTEAPTVQDASGGVTETDAEPTQEIEIDGLSPMELTEIVAQLMAMMQSFERAVEQLKQTQQSGTTSPPGTAAQAAEAKQSEDRNLAALEAEAAETLALSDDVAVLELRHAPGSFALEPGTKVVPLLRFMLEKSEKTAERILENLAQLSAVVGSSANPPLEPAPAPEKDVDPAAQLQDICADLHAMLAGLERQAAKSSATEAGVAAAQADTTLAASPMSAARAEATSPLQVVSQNGDHEDTTDTDADTNTLLTVSLKSFVKRPPFENAPRASASSVAAKTAAPAGDHEETDALSTGEGGEEAPIFSAEKKPAASRGAESSSPPLSSVFTPANEMSWLGANLSQEPTLSFADDPSNASSEALNEAPQTATAFATTLTAMRSFSGSAGNPNAIDQVVLQMNRHAKNGQSEMSLQLHPADLGKIKVKLEFGEDNTVTGTVVADNPQTLEILEKDSRSLERALQDAGLRADPGSLQFSLGEQKNHNDAGQAAGDGNAAGRDGMISASESESGAAGDTLAVSESYYITPSGVNIQV